MDSGSNVWSVIIDAPVLIYMTSYRYLNKWVSIPLCSWGEKEPVLFSGA